MMSDGNMHRASCRGRESGTYSDDGFLQDHPHNVLAHAGATAAAKDDPRKIGSRLFAAQPPFWLPLLDVLAPDLLRVTDDVDVGSYHRAYWQRGVETRNRALGARGDVAWSAQGDRRGKAQGFLHNGLETWHIGDGGVGYHRFGSRRAG